MYSQNISHLIYIDNMGRKTGSNNPSQSGAKAQQQINHLEKKLKCSYREVTSTPFPKSKEQALEPFNEQVQVMWALQEFKVTCIYASLGLNELKNTAHLTGESQHAFHVESRLPSGQWLHV